MALYSLAAPAARDDFSRRQILPADIFTRSDWATSAVAREVLDEIAAEVCRVPIRRAQPVIVDAAESIVMSGAEIQNSVRVGGLVLKQTRTVAAFEAPELSIVMEAPAAATPLQAEAQRALDAMARKPSARRPAPATPQGRPVAWALALVVVALGVTAWAVLR